MKTSRLVYLAAALAVAFTAGGTRIAANGATVTFTEPFPPEVLDACNGALVTMTGGHSITVSFDRISDNTGHILFKTATAGQGTDLLLRRYQVSDTYESEEYFNLSNAQDVATVEFDTHVIGPDQGDNFMVHSLVHITIANGVPTAINTDFRPRCQ